MGKTPICKINLTTRTKLKLSLNYSGLIRTLDLKDAVVQSIEQIA